jgi:hairy and enhancer of split related with YRPW motif
LNIDYEIWNNVAAAIGSGSGYNIDTAALALDCRLVGFRECAAEVARYLVSVEGLDIQDPLRVRLLSHLQCFNAQREAAAKATNSHVQPWSTHAAAPSHHQYIGNAGPPASSANTTSTMMSHQHQLLDQSSSPAYLDPNRSHVIDGHGSAANMRLMTSSQSVSISSAGTPTQSHQFVGSHQHSSLLAGLPPVHHSSQFFHSAAGATLPMLSPNSLHYGPSTATMLAQGVKPYRPWGTELAY